MPLKHVTCYITFSYVGMVAYLFYLTLEEFTMFEVRLVTHSYQKYVPLLSSPHPLKLPGLLSMAVSCLVSS